MALRSLLASWLSIAFTGAHAEMHRSSHSSLRVIGSQTPPPAGQVIEAKFERPYVPTADEVARGHQSAILEARLAGLRKQETTYLDRFYSLAKENYTKMVAAALPAVAAETSSSTAAMLGEMRTDLYRFSGPFYREVVLKRIQDNRAQQAIVSHQLATLNATVQVKTALPPQTAPLAVEAAPATRGGVSWTVLAVVCFLAVFVAILVSYALMRMRRAKERVVGPQTLKVSILKGTKLTNVDGFAAGESDPFCTCHVVGRPINEKLKTKTVDNNCSPVWNFTGELTNITEADTLEFEVWDKNAFMSDKFIGKVTVSVKDFVDQGGCEGDLALVGVKRAAAGHITVRIECEVKPPGAEPCSLM